MKKYLAEGRLLKETNTPRYPEGKLSIEDKIKAIVPLWQQLQLIDNSTDWEVFDQLNNKISRYTSYDNSNGGGGYAFDIMINAKSIKEVAKIIKKNEDEITNPSPIIITHSVNLLVPIVYFNSKTEELSDIPNGWNTDDEVKNEDVISFSKGKELDFMIFDTVYVQALDFAKRYPNLIEIINKRVGSY